MTFEPPPRLKTGHPDLPELARALDALRDGAADQARIARVADKLGPLLDAPAPSFSLSHWLGQSVLKSVAAKLFVSAVVLGALGAWMAGSHVTENAVVPAASAPFPPAVAPVVAAPPAFARARTRALRQPVAQEPETVAPQPAEVPAAAPAPARRTPSRTRTRDAHVAVASTNAAAAPASLKTADIEDDAAGTSNALTPAPEPQPQAPGEVDLLFMARRAMATDPAVALGLLEQHTLRFPHGMLAPEREVLAIQALRKLGCSAAAEERMARFRAVYPGSPHLRSAH